MTFLISIITTSVGVGVGAVTLLCLLMPATDGIVGLDNDLGGELYTGRLLICKTRQRQDKIIKSYIY